MTTPFATNEPGILDVDAAIREVLRETLATRRSPEIRHEVRGEEIFAGRLLSLRHAEGLAPGTRLVRLAPGTVITPLAREDLKKRGVELRFVCRADVSQATDLGEWGFAVERDAESGIVDALRLTLMDDLASWRELGGAADAAHWVAGSRSRGALVLAVEASVAVYRACRVSGVRAAVGEDPRSVVRAARALGVNLLVVEPAGKPIALLRQIAASYRRLGAPVVPGWLESTVEGGER
jgi:hypothetical protein